MIKHIKQPQQLRQLINKVDSYRQYLNGRIDQLRIDFLEDEHRYYVYPNASENHWNKSNDNRLSYIKWLNLDYKTRSKYYKAKHDRCVRIGSTLRITSAITDIDKEWLLSEEN